MKRLGKRVVSALLTCAMLLMMLPTAFAADADSFLNGPYLMAPKSDSMVVVWELSKAMKSTITYGVTGGETKSVEVPVEDGTAYKGEKMHMYRARLTGLTAGTTYSYTVALENGQKAEGSFRTLPADPKELRFVVVSDSHRFETAKQVSDAIAKFDPDFILHTGDMVEGTGSQKEQFSYWFHNAGDFLRRVPVIYNTGNHDYGDYYQEYVTKVQKEAYASNKNGHNISFTYGPVHFTMVDSNPWSLLGLNAVTGGTVNAETQALVDESLSWIKSDLASDAAKNADFRVMTMHHPYEDDLTRKYIPPIAEAGNVNLMLGGHTHVYSRTASADPARGARTLYVTQGDARIGDGKIDAGKLDARVNENFAETLATGKGDMLQVTVKDGVLTYANVGLKSDSEEVYETISLTKDAPKLDLTDVKIAPNAVQSGDEVTVSAKVTNSGKGLAAVALPVVDNGETRYLYHFGKQGRVVALKPGESVELSAGLSMVALGAHKLTLGGVSTTVNVAFRKADYQYSNLRVKLGDGEVSDLTSDRLHVRADVKNIGNEAGTASATLYVAGKAVETKRVALTAGQTRSVEFAYDFAQGGDYKVRVGTSPEQTVTVLGTIQSTPIVRDKSGLGNDGILRGAPTLVKYDGGYGLKLDGKKDYVEIPDRGNYKVTDGLTGMVWANVARLAQAGEWDHNPLLMKGASISYGTNYLYRMAVRQTGMVTYGVGFDNDNGEYFWNDDDKIKDAGVDLGKWVQYTGGFDRATGGTSWENTALSGQIDAPDFDSAIKNWEGKSMYAGFSFHRHLLAERGRGKTHTMLTGDLGQIRFYTAKLTEAENKAIYAAPAAKGPKGDKLVVWLDFDPKNIDTDGTHVTEWRPVVGALTSMNYDVSVPGAATAKATVEASADGKTVLSSVNADLKDGKGTIDLSALTGAKYVRVTTALHASVTEQATDIPVLRSYQIDAGNRNTWATLAAWNRGTLTGAIGYQPTDVFVDHSKDFDDLSGKADVSATSIGTDVAKSHWAYANLQTMIQKNLVRGDAGTGFVRPDERITREEVASALLATLHVQPDATGTLAAGDPSSDWAKGVLSAAKARGILKGDEKGFMDGQATATRAEVITMLARVASVHSDKVLTRFADGATVPSWAAASVSGMVESGLLTGYEDNTLRVNEPITRAETFTLLAKFCA